MLAILNPLAKVNTWILRIGRQLAWTALGLMVFVILLQVFFRYALNNALAWPDEAARFLMLWMAALIAPSAMRWSGFVSIDIVPNALPRKIALIQMIILFVLALLVLAVGLRYGYDHAFGFGGNFNSSSLILPFDWIGLDPVKVKLRYMYGSMLLAVVLMMVVTVELILRTLAMLIYPDMELPDDDKKAIEEPPEPTNMEAE